MQEKSPNHDFKANESSAIKKYMTSMTTNFVKTKHYETRDDKFEDDLTDEEQFDVISNKSGS